MKPPYTILDHLKSQWTDTPEFHQMVNENAIKEVNNDPELKAYRDYIEAGAWGFGERAFTWMWYLVMSDVVMRNPKPICLEIGVHRGAILALWKILNNKAECYGISPMNGEGLPGLEGQDFNVDVKSLHDHFGVDYPSIIKGYSTDAKIIETADFLGQFDIIYIDGSHKYEDAKADIINYGPMVKKGGCLIIDDACNDMHMPWGYFQGIDPVTNAVVETLPPYFNTDQWDFVFNFVHNRIYRRIK